jgi:hypothetical protein
MVTNYFVKRIFMLPMGRPKHYSKCLAFKVFNFLAREEGFFSCFPHSQYVPTMFLLSSHYVPLGFPISSYKVPQVLFVFLNMFSIAPHFYLICLSKMLSSFHPYIEAKGEEFNVAKWNFLFSELMSQGRLLD